MIRVKPHVRELRYLHYSVPPMGAHLSLVIQFVTVPFILLIPLCKLQESLQGHSAERRRLLRSPVTLSRRRSNTNDFILCMICIMRIEVIASIRLYLRSHVLRAMSKSGNSW